MSRSLAEYLAHRIGESQGTRAGSGETIAAQLREHLAQLSGDLGLYSELLRVIHERIETVIERHLAKFPRDSYIDLYGKIYKTDERVSTRFMGVDSPIRLSDNENPLGPSRSATEQIQVCFDTLHRYPPLIDSELRDALERHFRPYGLSKRNILPASGVNRLIFLIVNSLFDPGDEVVLYDKTFPVFAESLNMRGVKVRTLCFDNRTFRYDLSAIQHAITPRTRAIFLCTPNNPTGSTFPPRELDALLGVLPPRTLLILDECYREFVDSDPLQTEELICQERQVVSLRTFSKVYGLAGLRLGYALAPTPIIEHLEKALEPYHLPEVSIRAGIAALADQKHVQDSIQLVLEGRRVLFDGLRREGLHPYPSQGNFILFRPPAGKAKPLYEALVQRRVLIRDLSRSFSLDGFLRVTVGQPEENERFLAALAEAKKVVF